ncbi:MULTISPECIES: putative ATP-grasp-modified RiPP [Streptomyces violaceusniger group]|uniref:ATP-grasp-modified RiPP n=2 Tax=Streptomyces javensis TaxID=114698 RepID=A0ABS0RIP6_9ACTN|nr:putative ATP-grasp-modified RiPP [Streptomyces javensis]MBI0317300.1 putative ATP-grasp-modified RiPP [Streptomyces javensis]
MTTFAHPREAFPLLPHGERTPQSDEGPSGSTTRPWILRFARVPDSTQVIEKPVVVYDEGSQMSVGLYDGPLPYMTTHSPTVPDGNVTNPPPLDEGPKD